MISVLLLTISLFFIEMLLYIALRVVNCNKVKLQTGEELHMSLCYSMDDHSQVTVLVATTPYYIYCVATPMHINSSLFYWSVYYTTRSVYKYIKPGGSVWWAQEHQPDGHGSNPGWGAFDKMPSASFEPSLAAPAQIQEYNNHGWRSHVLQIIASMLSILILLSIHLFVTGS